MASVLLFVYGTLMSDQPAYHRLDGRVVGRTAAVLHHADLFAVGRYPMAAPGTGRVRGDLLEIPASAWPDLAARLDAYEGDEYRRVRREVMIPGDDRSAMAWVYLTDPAVASQYPHIADGDWRAHLARRQAPGGV